MIEKVGRDKVIGDMRLQIKALRTERRTIIVGMRESRRLKKALDVQMTDLRNEIKHLKGVGRSY
jgi:hypothetical protein